MWTNIDKRNISEIPFDKILIDKSILILNVCAYDCSSEGRLVVYNRMKKSPVIYMQNLLNCDEERKMNDTKVILNSVNGDLCVNGTLSSSFSFK